MEAVVADAALLNLPPMPALLPSAHHSKYFSTVLLKKFLKACHLWTTPDNCRQQSILRAMRNVTQHQGHGRQSYSLHLMIHMKQLFPSCLKLQKQLFTSCLKLQKQLLTSCL